MSRSFRAFLARATASESSAETARASSTEPAASSSSLSWPWAAAWAAAGAALASVGSSLSNSSQLSILLSPGLAAVSAAWIWGVRCTRKRWSGTVWPGRSSSRRKKGIVPGPGEGPCAASVALDERPSGAGQAEPTRGVRLARPRHGRRSATRDHWQASQSGLSMLHACGTGAGFGSAAGAACRPSLPPADTALSLPVLMVDFSVLVAARARR